MEFQKVGFFHQIAYAIAKPKKYTDLTKVSTGRLTGFVFLFILITTIVSFCLPLMVNEITGKGFGDIIENYVPDFEFKNGTLELYETTNVKENSNVFIADTSIESFSSEDLDSYPSRYTSIVLISKTNMLIYNNGSINRFVFADYSGFHLTKEILLTFVPMVYGIIAFVTVILYLAYVAIYFLTSLLYSLIGMLMQKTIGINLPFGYLFRIAIYSKVTMLIIRTLLDMFGYGLPFKFYISVAVTCAYMMFALIAHKNDSSMQMNQQPYSNNYNYGNNQGNNEHNQSNNLDQFN